MDPHTSHGAALGSRLVPGLPIGHRLCSVSPRRGLELGAVADDVHCGWLALSYSLESSLRLGLM